jgi:lysophospholipase L1-like esterase
MKANCRILISGLALATISLVVTLLLLEFAARLIPLWPDSFARFDPQLGFSYLPHARGTWVNVATPLEFRTSITINSYGLRDTEFKISKPKDITRILLLGDSMVAGFEVPLQATFAQQLERLLLESGYPVEVINGGHMGIGTDQELLFYRYRGKALKPDIVVLAFMACNDITDNLSNISALGAPKPYFELSSDGSLILRNFPAVSPTIDESSMSNLLEHAKRFLFSHSKLYKFIGFQTKNRYPKIKHVLTRYGLMDDANQHGQSESTGKPGIYSTPVSHELARGWALTQSIVRQLRHEVQDAGSEFIVMNLVDPTQFRAPENSPHWHMTLWNEQLQQFCTKEGLKCLDLYPIFQKRMEAVDTTDLFYRFDGHPTPMGHSVISSALYGYLLHESSFQSSIP